MRRIAAGFGLLALMLALVTGFARPASAEFFGCDDQRPARTSSHSRSSIFSRSFTHEFAAQTSRSRYSSPRTSTIDPRRGVSHRSRW